METAPSPAILPGGPSKSFRSLARGEEGQALVESAWLLAVLLVGATGLGWPFAVRLLDAWRAHQDAIRFVIESPFP
jgi:hypothetical protein